ncbi:MAG: Ribosome-binding factor A [Chlamydiae bacterium]|nr:Ribosome-binding factor A [Chlamydiota bacterium]
MARRRVDRLNSLLKEVISEVIQKDVKNPHINKLVTVTRVSITNDLRHAKVYISVIGENESKLKTLEALNQASGFIAINSSKKVSMRYFPELRFILDDSVEQHAHIEKLLEQVKKEKLDRDDNNDN